MEPTERVRLLATYSVDDRATALMGMTKEQRRETIAAMPPKLLSQMLSPRRLSRGSTGSNGQ